MNQIAESNEYDVLIVGAGPAGLNAALVLGRMRRRVLVVDTDAPAHAVSRAVHGFLAQDGTRPSDLRRVGRQQLGPYTTVELRHVSACAAASSTTTISPSSSQMTAGSQAAACCSHTACTTASLP